MAWNQIKKKEEKKPEIIIAKQKKLPWKEAFETTDNPYLETELFKTVNNAGFPEKQILVSLAEKDLSIHWIQNETLLWWIIIICSAYFLIVLFG